MKAVILAGGLAKRHSDDIRRRSAHTVEIGDNFILWSILKNR